MPGGEFKCGERQHQWRKRGVFIAERVDALREHSLLERDGLIDPARCFECSREFRLSGHHLDVRGAVRGHEEVDGLCEFGDRLVVAPELGEDRSKSDAVGGLDRTIDARRRREGVRGMTLRRGEITPALSQGGRFAVQVMEPRRRCFVERGAKMITGLAEFAGRPRDGCEPLVRESRRARVARR